MSDRKGKGRESSRERDKHDKSSSSRRHHRSSKDKGKGTADEGSEEWPAYEARHYETGGSGQGEGSGQQYQGYDQQQWHQQQYNQQQHSSAQSAQGYTSAQQASSNYGYEDPYGTSDQTYTSTSGQQTPTDYRNATDPYSKSTSQKGYYTKDSAGNQEWHIHGHLARPGSPTGHQSARTFHSTGHLSYGSVPNPLQSDEQYDGGQSHGSPGVFDRQASRLLSTRREYHPDVKPVQAINQPPPDGDDHYWRRERGHGDSDPED